MNFSELRTAYSQHLDNITRHLVDAQILLAELKIEASAFLEVNDLDQAREALLLDGVKPYWPALPTSEQATDRPNSQSTYIYLYWPRNRGPKDKHGKPRRKTYIGAHPINIKIARDMVANRKRWLALSTSAIALERDIQQTLTSLRGLAATTEHMLDRPRALLTEPNAERRP